MKTASRIFKLLVLVVIGVTAIFAFRAFAAKPPSMAAASHILKLKDRKLKKVDVADFQRILDQNEAIYCITFRKNANDAGQTLDSGGCASAGSTSVDDAKREMILVCAGAHVTQTAGFNSTAQMTSVENALYP
jgi:hypothetical protein